MIVITRCSLHLWSFFFLFLSGDIWSFLKESSWTLISFDFALFGIKAILYHSLLPQSPLEKDEPDQGGGSIVEVKDQATNSKQKKEKTSKAESVLFKNFNKLQRLLQKDYS